MRRAGTVISGPHATRRPVSSRAQPPFRTWLAILRGPPASRVGRDYSFRSFPSPLHLLGNETPEPQPRVAFLLVQRDLIARMVARLVEDGDERLAHRVEVRRLDPVGEVALSQPLTSRSTFSRSWRLAMSSVIVSTNSLAWSLKGALTNKVRAWRRNGNRRSMAVSPVKSFRNILEPVAIRSLPCAREAPPTTTVSPASSARSIAAGTC